MRVLVINGPNLNLLGKREKNQYGELTLLEIEKLIREEFPEIEFSFFQSNIEGELIDQIQSAPNNYDGLVINPGGYTHTSVAIKDALEIINIPKIEVHLSNLTGREDFRKVQITTPSTNGYISGFRENSYLAAIYLLKKLAK